MFGLFIFWYSQTYYQKQANETMSDILSDDSVKVVPMIWIKFLWGSYHCVWWKRWKDERVLITVWLKFSFDGNN